jgi:hypothetical protein
MLQERETTMSNKYLRFSFSVPLKSEEDRRWWGNKIASAFERSAQDIEEEGNCSFRVEGFQIVVSSYDYCNPDYPAKLIQEFLAACHPNANFSFEWAATSDTMEFDEFFGGGVFITKDEIIHFNPSEQISDARQQHGGKTLFE